MIAPRCTCIQVPSCCNARAVDDAELDRTIIEHWVLEEGLEVFQEAGC